jgi:hypothetical protein
MPRHVETLVPIDGNKRRDRKQNIGTFAERMAILSEAEAVLVSMENSGHFSGIDLDSLRETPVGFLRDSSACLLGYCSYRRGNGRRGSASPGERTWRILVNRNLVGKNDGMLAATLYHEFLHAVLGSEENHGPRFQALEALWPFERGGGNPHD